MVDINTAMAAAATERRNRGAGEKERKKNRSGADMGIEAFDPVKHVAKEKADMFSMWLVITFAASMALIMSRVYRSGRHFALWQGYLLVASCGTTVWPLLSCIRMTNTYKTCSSQVNNQVRG